MDDTPGVSERGKRQRALVELSRCVQDRHLLELRLRVRDQVALLFRLCKLLLKHSIDIQGATLKLDKGVCLGRMRLRYATDDVDDEAVSRMGEEIREFFDGCQANEPPRPSDPLTLERLVVNPDLFCVASFKECRDHSGRRTSPNGKFRYKCEVSGGCINQPGLIAYLSLMFFQSEFNIIGAAICDHGEVFTIIFHLETDNKKAFKDLYRRLDINTPSKQAHRKHAELNGAEDSDRSPAIADDAATWVFPSHDYVTTMPSDKSKDEDDAVHLENGDIYCGQCIACEGGGLKQHGFGTYTYCGQKSTLFKQYRGYWEEGKKHGHGVLLFLSGGVYVGQWAKNTKHGLGVLFDYSTESRPEGMPTYSYEGEWFEDHKQGRGVEEAPDRIYFGSFSKDRPFGRGVQIKFNSHNGIEGCEVLHGSIWRSLRETFEEEVKELLSEPQTFPGSPKSTTMSPRSSVGFLDRFTGLGSDLEAARADFELIEEEFDDRVINQLPHPSSGAPALKRTVSPQSRKALSRCASASLADAPGQASPWTSSPQSKVCVLHPSSSSTMTSTPPDACHCASRGGNDVVWPQLSQIEVVGGTDVVRSTARGGEATQWMSSPRVQNSPAWGGAVVRNTAPADVLRSAVLPGEVLQGLPASAKQVLCPNGVSPRFFVSPGARSEPACEHRHRLAEGGLDFDPAEDGRMISCAETNDEEKLSRYMNGEFSERAISLGDGRAVSDADQAPPEWEHSGSFSSTVHGLGTSGVLQGSPSSMRRPRRSIDRHFSPERTLLVARPVLCPMLWSEVELAAFLRCLGVSQASCAKVRERPLRGVNSLLQMSSRELSDRFGLNSHVERYIVRKALARFLDIDRWKNSSTVAKSLPDVKEDPALREFIVPFEELHTDGEISQGGFGKVFRGVVRPRVVRSGGRLKAGQDYPVAIKDMKGDDAFRLRELLKETRVMCALKHQNMCLFLGVCIDNARATILSELMDCSLFDLVHQPLRLSWKGSLTLPTVLKVSKGIVSGIVYLHSKKLVHADLKSSNILIDYSSKPDVLVPKICDFGHVAVRTHPAPHDRCGTPHWAAPEALRNEAVGTAADVFSFGVMLWEMLCQSLPHQSLTFAQVVGAVGWAEWVPDMGLLPEVPEGLRKLLMRCLNFAPEDRPLVTEVYHQIRHELRWPRKNALIKLSAFLGYMGA